MKRVKRHLQVRNASGIRICDMELDNGTAYLVTKSGKRLSRIPLDEVIKMRNNLDENVVENEIQTSF